MMFPNRRVQAETARVGVRGAWNYGTYGITVLLVSLLAGCAPSTSQVERGLRNELPRVVGPARNYDVQIEGLQARAGRAARLTATGDRVEPTNAPTLDTVSVELTDLQYNIDRGRLESVANAVANVRLTAADLAAFLEKQRNLEAVSVNFQPPDRVNIQARPAFEGIRLPENTRVGVEGKIEVQGARVQYVVTEVDAAGIEIGGVATQLLSDQINPLVDLSRMPVILDVAEVRVEDNVMRIRATGRYPNPNFQAERR